MAKQVYYSPARNGQPETAGTAQLPKGQCQEVSIVQLKKSICTFRLWFSQPSYMNLQVSLSVAMYIVY